MRYSWYTYLDKKESAPHMDTLALHSGLVCAWLITELGQNSASAGSAEGVSPHLDRIVAGVAVHI